MSIIHSTYENLKEMAEIIEEEDYHKLVRRYQKGEERCAIIAKIYCDNLTYLHNRAEKYTSIDDDDKASYALEAIHDVLSNFDFREAKVISVIGLYFENTLKDVIKKQKTEKRRFAKITESLEKRMENEHNSDTYTRITNESSGLKNFSYQFLKIVVEEKEGLTHNQKKLCQNILDNGGDCDTILQVLGRNNNRNMLI